MKARVDATLATVTPDGSNPRKVNEVRVMDDPVPPGFACMFISSLDAIESVLVVSWNVPVADEPTESVSFPFAPFFLKLKVLVAVIVLVCTTIEKSDSVKGVRLLYFTSLSVVDSGDKLLLLAMSPKYFTVVTTNDSPDAPDIVLK